MKYHKLTIAGTFATEFIMNHKPIPPSNFHGRKFSANPENKEKNRIKSHKKSQRSCTNYIECNIEPNSALITFTFDKNLYLDIIFDIKKANKVFEKFLPRLNNRLKAYEPIKSLKYLKFLDFSVKDNSIHFHVIFFNLPNISKEDLTKAWKFGNVDIKSIEEYQKIKNIDSYSGLSSYLLKAYTNTSLCSAMNNPKLYSPSKGLSLPISITNYQEEFYKVSEELEKAEIINQNTNYDLHFGRIERKIRLLKDNSLYIELLNS